MRARQEREERRRERACRRAMEGPPKPDFFSDVVFPPAAASFSSPPLDPGPLTSFVNSSPSNSSGSPPPGPSFAKVDLLYLSNIHNEKTTNLSAKLFIE